jgi:hypothetical protein
MGRPANPTLTAPSYTPRTFATDANYPAGADPWSGNPTKVEPASPAEGFVPETGASAEEMNKLLNDAYTTQADAKSAHVTTVSEVGTSLQNLIDYLAQGPTLNFDAPAAGGLAGSRTIEFIPATLQWIAFGPTTSGTVTAIRTRDRRTWPTANEIGAGAQIAGYNGRAAVDTSGNIVMPGSGVTDGDKVTEATSAAVWTKHAGVFAVAMVAPDVRFDVTSGLWCVCAKKNAVNAVQVYTSPDRTTWTLRTPPVFTFDAVSGPWVTLGSNGAGTLIMKGIYNASTGVIAANNVAQFSRSTDGGVTWSAPVSYAAAFANTTPPGSAYYDERPIWTGAYWISVESNDTDLKSYIFTSTDDGVSWTNVKTLTSVSIKCIAALGELLVALCKTSAATGRVIFSIDRGVTWYYTDENLSVSGAYIYQGAGRFATIAGANACFGSGSGMGVKVVT